MSSLRLVFVFVSVFVFVFVFCICHLTLSKAVCWLSSCVCGKAFIAVTVVSIFIRVRAANENSLENAFTLIWCKTFTTLKIWVFYKNSSKTNAKSKHLTCMIWKLIGWERSTRTKSISLTAVHRSTVAPLKTKCYRRLHVQEQLYDS